MTSKVLPARWCRKPEAAAEGSALTPGKPHLNRPPRLALRLGRLIGRGKARLLLRILLLLDKPEPEQDGAERDNNDAGAVHEN